MKFFIRPAFHLQDSLVAPCLVLPIALIGSCPSRVCVNTMCVGGEVFTHVCCQIVSHTQPQRQLRSGSWAQLWHSSRAAGMQNPKSQCSSLLLSLGDRKRKRRGSVYQFAVCWHSVWPMTQASGICLILGDNIIKSIWEKNITCNLNIFFQLNITFHVIPCAFEQWQFSVILVLYLLPHSNNPFSTHLKISIGGKLHPLLEY